MGILGILFPFLILGKLLTHPLPNMLADAVLRCRLAFKLLYGLQELPLPAAMWTCIHLALAWAGRMRGQARFPQQLVPSPNFVVRLALQPPTPSSEFCEFLLLCCSCYASKHLLV